MFTPRVHYPTLNVCVTYSTAYATFTKTVSSTLITSCRPSPAPPRMINSCRALSRSSDLLSSPLFTFLLLHPVNQLSPLSLICTLRHLIRPPPPSTPPSHHSYLPRLVAVDHFQNHHCASVVVLPRSIRLPAFCPLPSQST